MNVPFIPDCFVLNVWEDIKFKYEELENRIINKPDLQLEWIKDIVTACDKAKIPVFLKDNLIPMIDELPDNCFTKTLSGDMNLRQEMPKVK